MKLGKVHPLPRLVVEYRKVHAIVQNIMCPLLQAATFTDASGTFVRSFIHPEPPFFLVINRKKMLKGAERIAGRCQFRTETGRINIVQPNLQHIPRPFVLTDGQVVAPFLFIL